MPNFEMPAQTAAFVPHEEQGIEAEPPGTVRAPVRAKYRERGGPGVGVGAGRGGGRGDDGGRGGQGDRGVPVAGFIVCDSRHPCTVTRRR